MVLKKEIFEITTNNSIPETAEPVLKPEKTKKHTKKQLENLLVDLQSALPKKQRRPRTLTDKQKQDIDRNLAIGRAKSLALRQEKAKLKQLEKAENLLKTKVQPTKETKTGIVDLNRDFHVEENTKLKSKLMEATNLIKLQHEALKKMSEATKNKPAQLSTNPQKPQEVSKPVPRQPHYSTLGRIRPEGDYSSFSMD